MKSLRYPFLDLARVNEPYMDALCEASSRVVRAGRYIGGDEVAEFERKLAQIAQTRFAIGVSNGLDALRLILRGAVELGRMHPGDEVIVPANTYIASVLAITDAGLKPVLAEPSARTSNLDTENLGRLITPRTRAIMPVHLYGRPCWDETLKSVARGHGLMIIEDNAQAIGAKAGCPGLGGTFATGGLGHAAALSFYPTKNIGALGDAGAVTTNDEELAETVRALANYGADRRYHNIHCGFNCRLDSIQAALLNVKLEFVEEENNLRRKLAETYCKNIHNPLVELPEMTEGHVFHQFVIHCKNRDALVSWLDKNSVGWDIHYATPLHLQPCYADAFKNVSLPVTERLASSCLSLPVSRGTSVSDAQEIGEIINGFNQC